VVREAVRVDIATHADLERLADEVVRTRIPLVITRGDEDLVILSPAAPKRGRQGKRASQADIEAALATFGAWTDLDAEKFLRELDEARSDNKPPVKL
jgi:hypothetical protein